MDRDQENWNIDTTEEMYDTVPSRFALALPCEAEFSTSACARDGVTNQGVCCDEIDNLHDFVSG
jgi:hypothetical protein